MTSPKGDRDDPKGLIYEAYRIEGITKPDCRTIFLDWALSLPGDAPPATALDRLITRYGENAPDHPMTEVLREGRAGTVLPRRRGGWRGRNRAKRC